MVLLTAGNLPTCVPARRYVETSAKTNVAVQQAFEELVLKILETPDLVNTALGTGGVKLNQQATAQASTCSC
jgi:Ras-related protein Rab-18